MGHFSVAPLLIFLRTLVLGGTQIGKFLLLALPALEQSGLSQGKAFSLHTGVAVSTADLQRRVTICHHAIVRRIATNLWDKNEARLRVRETKDGSGEAGLVH